MESTQKNNVILRNCISINNAQKKTKETPFYGAGFLGGSPTMQFIDCTSQGNLYGFHLMDGATVIRGKDISSTYGFRTTDFHNIVLTDCWSDKAQQWAFYGFNSHDVTATNFKVTNPVGNPYPALLIESTTYPSYNMNIQLAGTTTAPVAQFKASTTSGNAPLTVFFTDQSTGNPTLHAWRFGDGTTSSVQNPTHKYKTAGTYNVTEVVSNSAGRDTLVKTGYITVK